MERSSGNANKYKLGKDEKGRHRMTGGHVWSEMSENPLRESEPKSKNPQVVEKAPPQSLPQVCFAQYYHGNAESSTSWPHAHTHTLTHTVCAQFHTYTVVPTEPCTQVWTHT